MHDALLGLVPERIGSVGKSVDGSVSERVRCADVERVSQSRELADARLKCDCRIALGQSSSDRLRRIDTADEQMEGWAVDARRGVERDGADENGLGGVAGDLLERQPSLVPACRLGEVQSGAWRKGEVEFCGFAVELCAGSAEDVTILDAFSGLELEEAAYGFNLAPDVTPAPAPATAHAAEGPGEKQIGRGVARVDRKVQTCAVSLRDEMEIDSSFFEQRVTDGVDHLA